MGKALISTMNELHCTAAEQLHFFHFLARWDRAPSTLPSDEWSIKLAPLLVSVQGEHFVVGVKFIEITRWAWAGHHTNDGPRDSPQETGDSRRARQDLWSGQGADTTQAKGIFTFFFATSEVQIGSHLFCNIWNRSWVQQRRRRQRRRRQRRRRLGIGSGDS